MDLLLIHLVLLVWLSVGAASRWTDHPADRILAAGALGWVNLIATALLISPFHRLGQPPVFLAVSLGLAFGTGALAMLFPASPGPATPAAAAPLWVQLALALTLGPLALASAAAAVNYLPASPAALAYELPRALLQIGGGSIFPLQAADARQVLLPFNHGLLQTWALIYQPPLPVLNFFNLLGWGYAGLAVHRLCRVAGWSPNHALLAAGCALTTTPVLAYAATADPGLPAAATLVAAFAFALDWVKCGRTAPAVFAGLLAGLAGGTTPAALLVLLVAGAAALLTGRLPRRGRTALWLGLGFGLLPFMINLSASFGTNFPQLMASLQRTVHPAPPLSPAMLWPLWTQPDILHAPTENSVSLGLPGLACLLAAAVCLLHPGPRDRRATWLSALALGCLGGVTVATRWLPLDSSELLLAILLAAPAIAAGLDRLPSPRLSLVLGVALVAGGAWSGGLYLWHNANRPLAALVDPALVPPQTSQVPALLGLRIAQEPRINFSADGEDPLLFTLMGRQQQQRFEAQDQLAPDAYNVISRSHRAQRRTLRQLSEGPAYLLIAFPDKPSSGIEFLGRMGANEYARDYFGISGNANYQAPIPANRTLLLTLTAHGKDPADQLLRADLRGLNPADHARLEVWGEQRDGQRVLLANFDAPSILSFRLPDKVHYLRMTIVSTVDGRELGTAVLTDYEIAAEEAVAADPHRLFSVEFVGTASKAPIRCSAALTDLEGPFPQWDLPFIRWARAETIQLQIPATSGLTRVRVRLEARLHVRPRAILEVVGNGEVLRRIEFDDPMLWQKATVEFTARPGENVIELRDVPLPPEPDWAEYLDRYPDVKRHAESIRQPLKEAALEHYLSCGRPEGRIMNLLPQTPRPAPDALYFMFRRLQVEGLSQ